MSDVTRILNAIERGDAKATDELLPLVYEELRLLTYTRMQRGELAGRRQSPFVFRPAGPYNVAVTLTARRQT